MAFCCIGIERRQQSVTKLCSVCCKCMCCSLAHCSRLTMSVCTALQHCALPLLQQEQFLAQQQNHCKPFTHGYHNAATSLRLLLLWHEAAGFLSSKLSALQVSQAVNAWREMPSAGKAAASASAGATRASQDIRRTVGMSGVTTVTAGGPQSPPSTAAASKPSTSSAAAAADDDDDDIEVLKEQSLDEVLAVSPLQRQSLAVHLQVSVISYWLASPQSSFISLAACKPCATFCACWRLWLLSRGHSMWLLL